MRPGLGRLHAHAEQERLFDSYEVQTVRVSIGSTKVITANRAVETDEDAAVYVNDFGHFVTVQFLEDTPPVPSLGKLCEDHGYSYANAYNATRRTTCLQSFLDYRAVLLAPVQLHRHLHLHHRTP